jgi:plastocyanin
MRPRIGVVVLCAAMAAIALPAAAAARTQLVWAGGPPSFQQTMGQLYSAEANDFFPRSVTINQGDSIEWQGMSINFHSIDLPGRSGQDLPLILPEGGIVSGVNDAAGNPFWFNGLPNLGFNTRLLGPLGANTYDGSERADSGLPLGPPSGFRVTFTKPGTYEYFCDVHYDMRGVVVVKPDGAQVPSAADNAATVAKQAQRDLEVAKALAATQVDGNRVDLGEAGKFNVEVLAMFPSTLHVPTGSTVTFQMSPLTGETHTATFGPESYRNELANSFLGAVFDPRAAYPSDPTIPISLSPTSHGNGFANSGALDLDAGTPLPPQSTITFTKPGTYRYQCLIHPFMRGTVVVS